MLWGWGCLVHLAQTFEEKLDMFPNQPWLRTLLFFCSVLILLGFGREALAGPRVLYTDLASGPNSGGENDGGTYLSIFGRGFGESLAAIEVKIGGFDVGRKVLLGVSNGRQDIQKLVVQLGSLVRTGAVQVSVGGAESNTDVSFTVRTGEIYFVDQAANNGDGSGTFADPWSSPQSYYRAAKAGDIVYMRAGTYRGEYGYVNWGANFTMRAGTGNNTDTGTREMPVSYVAYPGELVVLEASSGDDPVSNFKAGNAEMAWLTVAGFTMRAFHSCVSSNEWTNADGWRIVDNICYGLTRTTELQSGSILPGASYNFVLGNRITGGRTGSKMDHAIYSSGCGSEVDIGWNVIDDNNFARGPLIVVNYESNRCAAGEYAGNSYIHDNVIDSTTYRSRCIGVFNQSFESGDPVTPVSMIYNNVLIGCGVVDGDGDQAAIYVGNGAAEIHNNTLYETGPVAFSMGGFSPVIEYVSLYNNIFHMASGATGYYDLQSSVVATLNANNNLYFGIAAYTGPEDTAALNKDPLFVNAPTVFELQGNSPAINSGVDVSDVVQLDHNGLPRPQGPAYDIGAFEYPADVSIISSTLLSAQIDISYSAFLRATGGTLPYTWSLASGSLPAGLSLNASTGEISGTPTTADLSTFTVSISDSSAGGPDTNSKEFVLRVLGLSCIDTDGDGYGSPASAACTYATLDCDDEAGGTNPGAAEKCDDNEDNDCDGAIDLNDDDCAADCADNDGDGYKAQTCGGSDCDDADALVNPGAAEICDDLVDNNCDGSEDQSDAECTAMGTAPAGCAGCSMGGEGDMLSLAGLLGLALLRKRRT